MTLVTNISVSFVIVSFAFHCMFIHMAGYVIVVYDIGFDGDRDLTLVLQKMA